MRNKLFSTIYGNVGTNIQDTGSAMQTIIKTYANNAYFEILKRVNWDAINPDYQVSVVAGTRDYVLPSDFGKEKYVYDSTNLSYISWISLEKLADDFADSLNSSGLVSRYTTFQDLVRNQPSSASTISIVSSSASDVSQSIRIKGTDANDVEVEESVTITGLSAAVSTNSYKSIRSVSKSASTVGRITGTSNSGAVTNFIMAPDNLDYKVLKLRLHYTPSNALTLNVPYHIKPTPMSNDSDAPVFDCADGIELGATAMAWRYKRQFQKAQEYERLFEKWLVDAAWDMENQPNQTHQFNPKPYERDFV